MTTSLQPAMAKPFVKWAGGKSQLLTTFEKYYPKELFQGKIRKYVEPFVGSGAVLFDLIQRYDFDEIYIYDHNPELILAYQVIQRDVDKLVEFLAELEHDYLNLDKEKRKQFYYHVRDQYNQDLSGFDFRQYTDRTIIRAGQFIFLNKTCFNGLFRVNRSGHFNVPMGDYKNPKICDRENLMAVSRVLQKVNIYWGDYRDSYDCIDETTFVYFDPPYRPLNETSSFTSYVKDSFTDEDQIALAQYYAQLDQKGAFLMLSNSNPKNVDETDTFFDELYRGFNIYTVHARRTINSKAEKRGQITELLITNYAV